MAKTTPSRPIQLIAAATVLLVGMVFLIRGCNHQERPPMARTWSISVRNESDRRIEKVYLQYRGIRSFGRSLDPGLMFVASGEPGPVPEEAVLVWQWPGEAKQGMRVPIGELVEELGEDTLEFRFNVDGTISMYVTYLGTLQDSGELFRGAADRDVVIDPQPLGWE